MMSEINNESNTSLHMAIDLKSLSSVIASIRDGADVNCCVHGQTACAEAIYVGDEDILSAIVSSVSFDPDARNQFGEAALMIATKEGQLNFVRKLLYLGATVDQQNKEGLTALGAAADFDQTCIADMLMEYGADVNKATYNGETPLYQACKGNRISTARLLVERGSDVNRSTNDKHNWPGCTPLMASIFSVSFKTLRPVGDMVLSSQVEIIRLLLSNGCEVDAQDYTGRTALFRAILKNNIIAACLLLEANSSPNIADKFGRTPLNTALRVSSPNGSLAIVLLLYGADTDRLNHNSGVSKHNIFALTREMGHNRGLSIGDFREFVRVLLPALNPCHLETLRNQGHFVHLDDEVSAEQVAPDILEKALSTNELTLQSCCRYEIRKRLEGCTLNKINKLPIPNRLKLYLNLNLETSYFHPARASELYLAVVQGDVGGVQHCVQTGTSVEAPFCGRLPLTLAAEKDQKEVVHILLQLGANPSAVDASGESPLHLAARNAHCGVLQSLLLHRPDMKLRNKNNRTPLLEAAENGDSTTFKILIPARSDPTGSNSDYIESLRYSAAVGNSEIVRFLLDMGVDPDVMDWKGNRPIHIAASKGREHFFFRFPALSRHKSQKDHVGVIRALVGAGCDVRAQNFDGLNALDLCTAGIPSSRPNPELVRYLTDLFH